MRARVNGEVASDGLGTVNFPISCTAAQAKFDRAVALLHNFHYPETVKAFRAVLKDDPECAIAYWGLAMSAMPNPLVPPFSPAVIKTAQEATSPDNQPARGIDKPMPGADNRNQNANVSIYS
jgi:hypothetical protein